MSHQERLNFFTGRHFILGLILVYPGRLFQDKNKNKKISLLLQWPQWPLYGKQSVSACIVGKRRGDKIITLLSFRVSRATRGPTMHLATRNEAPLYIAGLSTKQKWQTANHDWIYLFYRFNYSSASINTFFFNKKCVMLWILNIFFYASGTKVYALAFTQRLAVCMIQSGNSIKRVHLMQFVVVY